MNTIAEKVFCNVIKYPQKIAIVDHDGTRETTWTELFETATKIACHAQREGLSGIVPILQGRTMEYVASILGLNMAGIAVVNLTDTYPEERVNYICEDVGASVCADDAFVERAMGFPTEPFEPCGDLSDMAMIFYTSGSTGTPKGNRSTDSKGQHDTDGYLRRLPRRTGVLSSHFIAKNRHGYLSVGVMERCF